MFSGHNKSLVKKSIGFAGYTEAYHSRTGRPPGGESWRAMYDRASACYHDVLLPASDAGRTVIVVARKYIVEMFAIAAAGLAPERYRDLKIPSARPLTEDELRRAANAPAAAGLLNDVGEIVEIRLHCWSRSAAAGVGARPLTGVRVPPGDSPPLWGGGYFFAVRHTVAASVIMPVALLGAVVIAAPRETRPGSGLGAALLTYSAVLLVALVLPGIGAQALRRRDPVRGGALSTNWNWFGGLTLVPLAGKNRSMFDRFTQTKFAIPPRSCLNPP